METVYISYTGHRVVLEVDDAEIKKGLVRIFEPLIDRKPISRASTLRVRTIDTGYYIDGATVTDPQAESRRMVLQHLKFEIIHQFIKQTPNQIWLHAAAASLDGKGILLTGAWGKGKSTIVSELCGLGGLYLSDDIVPIDMESGLLIPFHLTPMRREHTAPHETLSPLEISHLSKRVIPILENGYAQSGAELAAIVLPEYTPGAPTRLEAHSPALTTMTLLENCLNLKSQKAEAVHYLGQLVEKTPVYRLPYSDGEKGAELIEGLSFI